MISTKNLYRGAAALLGIASLAYAQVTFATEFTDTITYTTPVDVSHNSPATGTFDLSGDGFVVGTDTAVSGTATFDLSASQTGNQSNYKITIDLATDTEISSGGLPASDQYAISLGSDLLADINSTGTLAFSLSQGNSSVDFFLDSAELDVSTGIGSNARVPDNSSTAILLGSACLGLLGLRSFSLRKATVKVR